MWTRRTLDWTGTDAESTERPPMLNYRCLIFKAKHPLANGTIGEGTWGQRRLDCIALKQQKLYYNNTDGSISSLLLYL